VVALAAGWLLWRSRRRSAWDAQAAALEHDTHTTTGTQLPPVLTAEDAGQRALSWPPLRAALVELLRRWDLLAERAPDDQRQQRSGQVRNLLQELIAAVDAENQALATGRDWRLLRPRVDHACGSFQRCWLAYRNRSQLQAGNPGGQPPADDHLLTPSNTASKGCRRTSLRNVRFCDSRHPPAARPPAASRTRVRNQRRTTTLSDGCETVSGMGHLLGYARVSTTNQQPQLQVDALQRAGCYRVFTETASGANSDRPILRQVLDQLRPGDTLIV